MYVSVVVHRDPDWRDQEQYEISDSELYSIENGTSADHVISPVAEGSG
jgi:hypothetical protein